MKIIQGTAEIALVVFLFGIGSNCRENVLHPGPECDVLPPELGEALGCPLPRRSSGGSLRYRDPANIQAVEKKSRRQTLPGCVNAPQRGSCGAGLTSVLAITGTDAIGLDHQWGGFGTLELDALGVSNIGIHGR